MADYTINDYTDCKVLPLTEFKMTFAANTITFKNLREGASVSVRPLTRIDDRGLPFVVAYKIEASAEIMEMNYEQMLTQIQLINKSAPTQILFTLKGDTAQMDIQVKDSLNVNSWGCFAEFVADGDFPAMRITMQGIFSVELIDMTTNHLFKQNWS